MKYIFIILSVLFLSCEKDELIEYTETNLVAKCYTVFSYGIDSNGSFIIVGTNKKDTGDRQRYKVDNYLDYKYVREVCNVDKLVKQ